MSDHAESPTAEAEPRPGKGMSGLAMRTFHWATGSRPRMAISIAAGLASLGTTFATWSYLAQLATLEAEPASVELAFAALDAGRFDDAKTIIGRMGDDPATPATLGGAMFVLGAVKVQEGAVETSPERRTNDFVIAARYLEKARELGVPRKRRAQSAYLLGWSLVESGKANLCVPLLEEALAEPALPATAIHALLVRGYLDLPEPDLESALKHNERALADARLDPAQRNDAWLRQAEILYALKRRADAMQALAQISRQQPWQSQRLLLLARFSIDDAKQQGAESAAGKRSLDAALDYTAEVQQLEGGNGPLGREAMFWTARCHELAGRALEAEAMYSRLGKLYGDTPEGVAAMFAMAERAQAAGRMEQALEGYRNAVQVIVRPQAAANRLLPVAELRERLTEACKQLTADGMFAEALEVVALSEPLLGRVECIESQAKIHEQWAVSSRNAAELESGAASQAMMRESRYHERAAGQAYETLARMRFATRFFSLDLWTAAECFFHGQSYTNAARLLEEYLHHEARRLNPLALVRLGQARLATGACDEAISALTDCVELYPDDAVAHQARLECARAYQQVGKPAEAEELLSAVLSAEALSPLSPEWRASLFELGHLLYEQGRNEEAIVRLDEAVRRYPDDPSATLAKYTIARAYQREAERIATELRQPATDNDGRISRLRKQFDESLQASHRAFLDVRKSISADAQAEGDDLTATLLRNCYMMQGAVLFEMRRYEEARQAFQSVITMYHDDPIVLEGFVQVANCWRRMGQPVMARGNLKQARLVLDKMPQETDFLATTNFNRQQWEQLLEEMGRW